MDKRRLLWLFNAGERLVYLLRDEFTTDEAAPITSPRTCEPGPGTLTVVDTANCVSVVSGKLKIEQKAGAGTANPRLFSGSYTRTSGLFIRCIFDPTNEIRSGFGFNSANNSNPSGATLTALLYANIGGTQINLENIDNSHNDVFVICRNIGFFVIAKIGVSGDYKLYWVDNSDSASSVYGMVTFAATGTSPNWTMDNLLMAVAQSSFSADYGIATNRVASPAVDETTTSEANALIEMTWQAVTGQTWELSTRRTDDDNRWIVRCDQAGSTIKLIERNAGVETERSSAAQTWTNGTQYRLVVIQDGNTIRTYVANIAKNTYTSASFNNTATGVETDKAGSNLVTYPRTLSGAALAELQRWTS